MGPFYRLGPTIRAAWAKSENETGASMPLVTHLADTAEVARIYWQQHLSQSVRSIVELWIDEKCPSLDGPSVAHRLAIFLAATHDCGKLSPAFAMQVPSLARKMRDAGYDFISLSPDERRAVPHAWVSQVHLAEWLTRRTGQRGRGVESLAVTVGGHHGAFPNNLSCPSRGRGTSPIWQGGRDQLLDAACEQAGLTTEELSELCRAGLSQPAQIIITGFIIVCDWIASNADLFSYTVTSPEAVRAARALTNLGLPPPWRPSPPDSDDDLWRDRFAFPAGGNPRPVQEQALAVARALSRPGLELIEAPTGEGKTEAAYAAAEILAARFGCGGVMTALPTQATSDAMFRRKQRWLEKTVEGDVSVALSHGKAQFNEGFIALYDEIPPAEQHLAVTEVYDESDPSSQQVIRAHWWLAGRKKSALADFVVGTIDQVLLAALVSRHVVLRHLGLAGKVVILDEIHATDQYMQVYLDRALEWLGALGTPVIALSATLPPARRAEMLQAYQRGRGDSAEDRERTASLASEAVGYPLISTTESEIAPISCPPSDRQRAARIRFLSNDQDLLVNEVTRAAEHGGCVAIIHNTVRRAQRTYRSLRDRYGDDVVLLHSQFIAEDRLTTEKRLREWLGPDGSSRPERLIVVSTQVLEQSLDLDFDIMFTDLAPIDTLIQRLGRLHRHDRAENTRPETLREAQLIITGVERRPDQEPVLEAGGKAVYGAAPLLRSLAVLETHLASHPMLTSPQDVAGLVRAAYEPDLPAPAGWTDAWFEAEQEHAAGLISQKQRAATFCVKAPARSNRALLGWSDAMSHADDEQRSVQAVRDAADTLEVVVVIRDSSGHLRSLPWLAEHADQRADLGTEIPDGLARAIARCTLRLPVWVSRGGLGDQVITELERDGLETWQRSIWLKGVLPLVLDRQFYRRVANLAFRYDREVGLLVEGERV